MAPLFGILASSRGVFGPRGRNIAQSRDLSELRGTKLVG